MMGSDHLHHEVHPGVRSGGSHHGVQVRVDRVPKGKMTAGLPRTGGAPWRLSASRGPADVQAVTHFRDPEVIARVSRGLGEAMPGLEIAALPDDMHLAARGA